MGIWRAYRTQVVKQSTSSKVEILRIIIEKEQNIRFQAEIEQKSNMIQRQFLQNVTFFK